MHQPGTAVGGNLGECPDLLKYGVGDRIRGKVQLPPPEIPAIGIAGMRPQRELPAKRLLDRGLHGLSVARMAPAGDVDRSERRNQRFLSPVGNGLRQLTHIAIQIHALHPKINSSAASSFSCSWSRDRACSQPIGSNRSSSRGRSCPTPARSAEITLAIFGYPPVVCCSTNRMIGCPPAGAWIAPSETPSVIICPACGVSMAGPESRKPMRLDSSVTVYGLS